MGALGVDLDEGLEFVQLADHLVDLWDVTVGSIAEWALDSGPSRFFAEGWQLESTARVREATAKPIVGVGRLTDPDRMAEIVRSGVLGPDRRRPSLDRRPVPAAARSTRAASTRSASASAATSASPRPTAGATSAAPRTRPPARSTGAAGIPSASRRCAPASTRSWSAAGPRAWSARSRSPAAARRACASSSARRRWAATRLAHAPARPRRMGARDRLPHGGAQAAAERRAHQRASS